MATTKTRKRKVKGPDWEALKAKVKATDPKVLLAVAQSVDGWTIFDPKHFTDKGLDAEVVAAYTRTLKSGRDPKSTIFKGGVAVRELSGVYGLEVLEFIARCFEVYSDKSGRGFRADHLTEQLAEKLK